MVRGYKAGILTQNQYSNLTQCDTIEGVFRAFYKGGVLMRMYLARFPNAVVFDGLWQFPRERAVTDLNIHNCRQGYSDPC